MKKAFSTLLLTTAVISQLTACSGGTKTETTAATQKVTITANKESMDASQLADAGEQLMGPYTWMLADQIFSMTLEKDPQNQKAQFYKAFLKPMMSFRGILTRIKPYARTYGDINKLEDNIKKFPESPMKTFLLDGKEDIKTIGDMQSLLVEQREGYSALRTFLKQNANLEMTIYLNPSVWQDEIQKQAYDSCVVNNASSDDGNMSVDCNYSAAAMKKMNSADVIALGQMVSGLVLTYDFYTSYSAEGIDQIMQQLNNDNLTQQQQQKLILSVPTVGKLRADNALADIMNLGADFGAAEKWALQYQDRLCALGEDQQNRKGYVFEKGICITDKDEAQRIIAVLNQALAGPFSTALDTANGDSKNTTLDIRSFLTKPVQDLRSVAPVKFNTCGEAVSLGDKSLGGLFPKNDAETFLLSSDCGI